ncbi:MAG TPA: hypothetical protein DHW82_10680 [Spirochaetia bacterium]|nr:MAG: hypothetical protein A2Y41_10950 [Spirochaetes bacterium GWB1_36_13]HCL57458.1 hypothetical protein [Spirochaetia bacterium]
MPYTKINGLDFYYEITGKGNPVIFINGIFATTLHWGYQVNALKNDFRVITFDGRDQGQTQRPTKDYVFQDHISDLKGLMDNLGIEKADIAAISHGSTVAGQFASQYPEKVNKLVLISGIADFDPMTRDIFKFIASCLEEQSLAEFYKTLMLFGCGEVFYAKIADKLDLLADDFAKRFDHNRDIPHRLIRAARAGQLPFTKKLANITAPTLVVAGRYDRYINLSRAFHLKENIKNSKLVIIEECGHTVNIEKPEELNQVLFDFLKDS